MSNYYDDMMENDPDFRKEYDQAYDKEIHKKLNEIEDEDEREEVMEALSKLRYVRSTSANQDCDNNLLRAKTAVKERRAKSRDSHVEDFLSYIAKEEKISKTEARKKYRKAMQDTDRTGLTKYGM